MDRELEEQIARQVLDGDPEAIERLLDWAGGKVNSYLRRRFPSLDAAQLHDVLVDALLDVGTTFDPSRGRLGPWLLMLAHQGAVARLRRKVEPSVGGGNQVTEPEDHQQTPDAEAVSREEIERIGEGVLRLPPMERAVIEADISDGGTADAGPLAERLQVTVDAVYAARRRARLKLKDYLFGTEKRE